jgi:hypothetical protein
MKQKKSDESQLQLILGHEIIHTRGARRAFLNYLVRTKGAGSIETPIVKEDFSARRGAGEQLSLFQEHEHPTALDASYTQVKRVA